MAGQGRRVFTAGDVLTAAQVQDFLQDQTIMQFATTAARTAAITTPTEGMFAVTLDDDVISYYNGTAFVPALPIGAWQTYAPVISSGGAAPVWANGNGVYNYAKFCQIGKTVHFAIRFTFGTTTTKSTTVTMSVSLPVTASSIDPISCQGRATVAGSTFALTAGTPTTTTIQLFVLNSAGTFATLSGALATVPATWVTGDIFILSGTYEAA